METSLSNTTTTGMKTGVPDYQVSPKALDTAGGNKEQEWINTNFTKYLGYYKNIPELQQAINALAMWTAGKGWESPQKRVLDFIKGWGEDSFDSIMQNMITMKKINGDAYCEIIRDDENGDLINLKPLNPQTMKTIVNQKGIIIRYEEWDSSLKELKRTYKPQEIFHITNGRTGNEIHGISVIESCQWVIDAKNEAMSDWRRILHRSSIRVMYVDAENSGRINTLKEQYKEAIKNGELLIIPAKRSEAEIEEVTAPPLQPFLEWIRYLDNFFYRAVGVPRIITGGSEDFTEASSKVGYLTFEQVYMTEQKLLEQDIWGQLGIIIKFNRPVSLKDDMMQSEAANTGQVGFQPNEMMTGMTRTE